MAERVRLTIVFQIPAAAGHITGYVPDGSGRFIECVGAILGVYGSLSCHAATTKRSDTQSIADGEGTSGDGSSSSSRNSDKVAREVHFLTPAMSQPGLSILDSQETYRQSVFETFNIRSCSTVSVINACCR